MNRLAMPESLQERMVTPRPALVDDVAKLEGDLLVLGAGGKLGPTLVRLALRAVRLAGTGARVIAASRFSDRGIAEALAADGAEICIADLEDDDQLRALPRAANVVFLAGMKFGTDGREHQTWATNVYVPGRIAELSRGARTTILSSGNVYPFSPLGTAPDESTQPAPVGEYAATCLGRERIFTHFALKREAPLSIIRLNYAVELRYGVLIDLATRIGEGAPIDLTTPAVNVIWQGYANEVILRSLLYADVPPFILNLTGNEELPVRALATALATEMDRSVAFTGQPATTALLSSARRCAELFGEPDVGVDELVSATAEWVSRGGDTLNKPTGFERRDGRF